MGPVYYVIAILGCGDGSIQCAPVATVPTHYTSQASCAAATQDALLANSDLDFPTLVAQCRPGAARPAGTGDDRPAKLPVIALRS
jgi:hypothetical protein